VFPTIEQAPEQAPAGVAVPLPAVSGNGHGGSGNGAGRAVRSDLVDSL
jgi:hypothetical protein